MSIFNEVNIEDLKTPHRWGKPVVQGSGAKGAFDEKAVDCPFVFRHNDRFYMMYVGFDGSGYQTALAVSDNLIDWQHEGVILGRSSTKDRWDHVGAAGSWMILESNDLLTTPKLKKIDGKYWLIYHAYPDTGYEAGGAQMGLAWCEDENLLNWHRLEQPVFCCDPSQEWEQSGLYKCCVIEHDKQYYMFYNAKGGEDWPWKEETGLAVSSNLIDWVRSSENPLLQVDSSRFYSQFYSDPCVKKLGDHWINFGFGFDGQHAQGALAVSRDLIHWEYDPNPWIPIGKQGELDAIHAHKSSVLFYEGVLYHFYCAARFYEDNDVTELEVFEGQLEFRCITVATSQPI